MQTVTATSGLQSNKTCILIRKNHIFNQIPIGFNPLMDEAVDDEAVVKLTPCHVYRGTNLSC